MNYRFIKIVFVCVLSLLIYSTTEASRKQRIKPPSKNIDIEHKYFAIAPYFTGGWIIGEGADYIESNNKALYGLGSAFIYHWKPKLGFYGNLEVVYGNVSDNSITKYRVISYSGGMLFTLFPNKKSSMYLKCEYGNSKVRATEAKKDYGNHAFLKLGIGSRIYSSSTISTMFEIYYKRLFNKDEDLEYYYIRKEIDGEYIGILFSVSFGI